MKNFSAASQFLLLLVCSCLLPSLIAAPANDHFSPLGFFRRDLRALNPAYAGGAVYVFNDPFALSAVASPPKVAVIGVTRTGEPDGFSFVAGEMLLAGTNVYFTDEEYRTSCSEIAFDNGCTGQGEPYLTYTVPAGGLPAGSVVSIVESVVTPNTFTVTGGGTVAFAGSGGFSLTSSDGIIAFESNNASDPVNNITCIYSVLKIGGPYTGAITDGDNPVADYPDAVITILPAGADDAEFMPSLRSGMVTNDDIEDVSNWNIEDPAANLALSTTNFTGGIDLNFSAAACANPLPTATLTPTAATCTGSTANNDGTITLAAATNATHYGVSLGATYTGPATIAGAMAIPGTLPAAILTNAPNAGATYVVRLFNGADDCFVDEVVMVAANACAPASTCNCTEYLYVNDVDNNEIHKFAINPTTGALTEIGMPWRDNFNFPHGLTTDLNGFLYVSAGVDVSLTKLTCDGDIVLPDPAIVNPIMVDGSTVQYRTTNYSSQNGVLYVHSNTEEKILAIRLCDGSVIGSVELPGGGNIQSWGHYNDGEYLYIPNRANGGEVYRVSLDTNLYTMPTTNFATLLFATQNSQPMGMTRDGAGNFYIIENQLPNGSNDNISINKYSPTGVFIAGVTTATNNGGNLLDGEEGWWGTRQLVWSETTNLLYLGAQENCVAVFNTDLVEQVALNIGNPTSGSSKTISIVKECCPTGDLILDETVCSNGQGEKIFLQDFLSCGDGIVCEGMWSEGPNTSGGAIEFNECDLSITVNGFSGCATYILEKTTLATGNQQCGAFSITLNICISAPAATLTPTAATCTGSTANDDGTITLAAATNATHYGVSLGATYTGPTTIAGATAIPGTLPAAIITNAPNAGATYVVRLFNGATDCFTDVTVTMQEQDCTVGCNCTDYLYLNDVFGATAGNVNKFRIDPTDGSLTEIGSPWFSDGGVAVPNPHGLGVDFNGFLYIGEDAVGGSIRKFRCDGSLLPASEFSFPSGGQLNIGSTGNNIYYNEQNSPDIVEVDICTQTITGRVTLGQLGGPDWGFYIDPVTKTMYATGTQFGRGANNLWIFTAGDFSLVPNTVNPVTLSPSLPQGSNRIGGVTTDEDGNIYIVVTRSTSQNNGTVIRKYDASLNFVVDSPADDITNNGGYNGALGIAYSRASQRIYVAPREADENTCIAVFDNNLNPLPSLNVAGTPGKGIAISTECCPTNNNQTVELVRCNASATEALSLNEIFPCDGGVICEAQWEPADAASEAVFNDCNQTILAGTDPGCYSFTRSSDGTGSTNQCGAFVQTFTIAISEVMASIVGGDQEICLGEDPDPFTVTTAATGSDDLDFQWFVSSESNSTGFTPIAGATMEVYDPTVADIVADIMYFRLVVSITGCPGGICADTSNVVLVITRLDSPTPVDAPFTICADETATNLTANDATVLDGEAGTVAWYNGDPADGGTLISPATAVNLNTVTDLFARVIPTTGSCTADVDVTVTINPLPIVSLNDPADVCIDGTDMSFTATPAGGVFTTNAATGFTANNAAGTATLDVSAAGAGTYNVTYTYTDLNGCDAFQTVSVTVFPEPVVTLNDPADVCIDGTDMSFTGMPTDANGVFTTTAGAGFTDNGDGTASLDVSVAGAGTYDVTYTYTDLNGCDASQTVSVEVFALPEVTVFAPATLCSTRTIDLTVNASVSPADLQAGAVWTTSGTGSFDGVDPDGNAQTGDFLTATTYTPSAADIVAGEVILTLTSGNPADQSPARACDPGSASVTFTILNVDCGSFPWDGNAVIRPTLPGSGM